MRFIFLAIHFFYTGSLSLCVVVRACVRACVRVCVRACVRVRAHAAVAGCSADLNQRVLMFKMSCLYIPL